MPDCPEELVAQERAALLAWWLARGGQLTTRQAADKLGVTYLGAWRILQKLSRVLPIVFDPIDDFAEGYWYAIS